MGGRRQVQYGPQKAGYMHASKQAFAWDMTLATLALFYMQKQRTATAVSTETVEADSELGAPKFLPFVQQVKHNQAQHG